MVPCESWMWTRLSCRKMLVKSSVHNYWATLSTITKHLWSQFNIQRNALALHIMSFSVHLDSRLLRLFFLHYRVLCEESNVIKCADNKKWCGLHYRCSYHWLYLIQCFTANIWKLIKDLIIKINFWWDHNLTFFFKQMCLLYYFKLYSFRYIYKVFLVNSFKTFCYMANKQ